MAEHIYKCLFCEKYTMERKCSLCSKETIIPRPPKFSLNDKYAELKRTTKIKELVKAGLY